MKKKSVYFSEIAYLLDLKIKNVSMKTDMKDTCSGLSICYILISFRVQNVQIIKYRDTGIKRLQTAANIK